MDKSLFSLLERARLKCALLAWLCSLAGLACAQAAPADPLVDLAMRYVRQQVAAAGLPRTQVTAGKLDARLRLTPCEQVRPYLPGGTRLWGKTRVGLRCVKGVTPWSVYLPVTVNVYGPALVSNASLPAGHVLTAADFHQGEVNLAEDSHNALVLESAALIGRTLARPLGPGESLRQASLKARVWFAAGEPVQIRVAGNGFAIAGAGVAVTAGMEGQPARVRTESGRVVSGMPVADRQLEITL